MKLSQFDFDVPERLIAQFPLSKGDSRMMVLPGWKKGIPGISHQHTRDLVNHLAPGDGLVINNTRVIPARLIGTGPGGGRAEILLLENKSRGGACIWEVMVKPGKRFRPGALICFSGSFSGRVEEILESGSRLMSFDTAGENFDLELAKTGRTPLPPYIRRDLVPEDEYLYQSVFAERPGSVAAPTASLHVSREHLKDIERKGIRIIRVTLHVGAGTFFPVKTDDIEAHDMHEERFEINEDAADMINQVKRDGGRIWAMGTTAARVLESSSDGEGRITKTGVQKTKLFIYPGYKWKIVDGLLTNFHWPRSTLFMLVSSLLGIDRARAAYDNAIKMEYRLFSYGDAMLIY